MTSADTGIASDLKSWVHRANQPDCEFPIQNLLYGIFQTAGTLPRARVAIGECILDLRGWCQGDGYRVGFGHCSGVVLPALHAQ